jgi:hypothetical protein
LKAFRSAQRFIGVPTIQEGKNMPFQGYAVGLYLVRQWSARKGVYHWGIADIGNILRIAGADGVHPVIVHQCRPGIRADWLQGSGVWEVLGKIDDEAYAIARYHAALDDPAYDLFGHNCEHFARFVATGIHESKQLQAVGWVVGLTALAIFASADEPQKARRATKRRRAA